MYEGENPTALKSVRWITGALVSLMAEKDYAEISVRDICQRADLSRQTFYNLFDSKDDVLTGYLRSEVGRVFERVSAKEDAGLADMVEAFAEVLGSNRALLERMIEQGLEGLITEVIAEAVGMFAKRFSADTESETLGYSVAFLSGGLARCMLYWFKQDKPLSLEELTGFLEETLTGATYRLN